jgi:putative redox protein
MKATIDKSKELLVSLTLVNEKLHFAGIVDNNDPISIDYVPPLGDNLGYTSLELFLLSLSSCIGSTVLLMLRKMQKRITGCSIAARGYRKEQHPTGFQTIIIELTIQSQNLSEFEIGTALKMSEEKYCPVWDMIKGNVEVNVKTKIIQ